MAISLNRSCHARIWGFVAYKDPEFSDAITLAVIEIHRALLNLARCSSLF